MKTLKRMNGDKFQFLGRRQSQNVMRSASRPRGADRSPRSRRHDPMLVLNMAIFNFANG